jgi:hypothetical protein
VPSAVLGQFAPSKRINIGAIGVGRISRVHDMPMILQYDRAKIMAVCDLDAHRVEDGKKFVNDYYANKTGKPYDGVTGYANYHDLLANKDIDAVVVSTPDHWHALIGVDAVRAGKDVYLQKPASLTIAEGRALSNAVQASGAFSRLAASSAPPFSFATRQNWCATAASATCSGLRSACPATPPAATKLPCRCPTGSTTKCGSAKHPMCITPSIACIRKRATIAPAGCAAGNSAPA